MGVLAVIPARYDSTRFPGKPLVRIAGKPMIQRTMERVRLCPSIDRTVVATDDLRIADTVTEFGGEVILTAIHHPSGTDRCAEVVRWLDEQQAYRPAIVVNVQGDEPLIDPAWITSAVAAFQDPGVEMVTLAHRLESDSDREDPNRVKLVTDAAGNALYFSRAAIPYPGDGNRISGLLRIHVGLYAFRRDTLLRFVSLHRGQLEMCEKLEQLRALENHIQIRVIDVEGDNPAVDTPEDVARVEKIVKSREGGEL